MYRYPGSLPHILAMKDGNNLKVFLRMNSSFFPQKKVAAATLFINH